MMNMRNGQTEKKSVVRPATQANLFYTGDARELREEVDSFLALNRGRTIFNNVAAVIVPHAGYYFSGNVAAAAYMSIPQEKKYKRIFLLGPSHHEWLDGASVNTDADYYATPLGQVKVDHETAMALTEKDSVFRYEPKAHDREHCLEVQLPFLQRRFGEDSMPAIVPIIISTNDFQKLKRIAEMLKSFFSEENLFVVSSDFAHYPKYEDACKVDALTGKAIESGDVEQFIATLEKNARSGVPGLATSACGELAIATLMMMMDSTYQVKHLIYQNSGDAEESDHSRVVGYHAFAIIRNGQALTDTDFSLSDRGCIGHFGEDVPLHEIVAEMARAAAFEDPRFMPVTYDELADIDIEISVLTPMRRIQSLDEFELHRHGIYIRKGYRSGTYLPQVADEVNWTKEEFVCHCAQDKAGIGWDGWKDAELYVYEAIVF